MKKKVVDTFVACRSCADEELDAIDGKFGIDISAEYFGKCELCESRTLVRKYEVKEGEVVELDRIHKG